MEMTRGFTVPQPVRLTVSDFEVLHHAGALVDHHHAQLIEGTIVAMSPQARRHAFAKNELTYRLRRALETAGSTLTALSEVTVSIPPYSAPEPDLVLTDAPQGEGYVPVDSVALIAEVADSTVRYDLDAKQRLYGTAGIPEYWVLDLPARTLHRFCSPVSDGYERHDILPLTGPLDSATLTLTIDGTGIV
ncbi:Uma2 family endonuclease [Sphingomonas carotinifaciens]|uniref:Uma2 family endonuclease n=1 Tax=Sphingomonas carotinifaciens TaxID=1166323 RepID=UPI000DDA9205|nr:Uma2 family endonuclease [Sphingomonas carotinifaciens]